MQVKRRKEKFLRELAHFEYLKKRGLTSFEIADSLIHGMFEMMRIGLEKKYPTLSPKEIDKKMREIAELDLKIKNKRKRGWHGRV